MTAVQIIEEARERLPYTSEFDHDVIRVPVSNTEQVNMDILLGDAIPSHYKPFYEVEFRKQYIKSIAVGWEFVKIY